MKRSSSWLRLERAPQQLRRLRSQPRGLIRRGVPRAAAGITRVWQVLCCWQLHQYQRHRSLQTLAFLLSEVWSQQLERHRRLRLRLLL